MRVIDSHAHVTAPGELYAYKAGLLAHRGAHGRGKVNLSDEQIIGALNAPTFGTAKRGRPDTHLRRHRYRGVQAAVLNENRMNPAPAALTPRVLSHHRFIPWKSG